MKPRTGRPCAVFPVAVLVAAIGLLFLSGAQMLALVLLGQYIDRIDTESKRRPPYLLRETLDVANGGYVAANLVCEPEGARRPG